MASKEKFNLPGPLNKGKSPSREPHIFKDRDMQVIIGWILRVGVTLSVVIVFIGGVIYLSRHGHSIPDYHEFKRIPYFIHNTEGIISGVLNLKGQAIIQFGILLLIATPVLRVIFSAIGFMIEKDHLYTAITLIVLLIILASVLSGQAG
jgi:uncharacterized membrane protein